MKSSVIRFDVKNDELQDQIRALETELSYYKAENDQFWGMYQNDMRASESMTQHRRCADARAGFDSQGENEAGNADGVSDLRSDMMAMFKDMQSQLSKLSSTPKIDGMPTDEGNGEIKPLVHYSNFSIPRFPAITELDNWIVALKMSIGKASRYPSAKEENIWLDEVPTKSLQMLREVGHDHPRFGQLSRMLSSNLLDVLPSDLDKRVRDENKKQIETCGEPLSGRQMLKLVFEYYREYNRGEYNDRNISRPSVVGR